MKKYKPNFNDPRVASKASSALGWATQQLHEHKYASWSTRHLDKRIGYSHTNLGRYLRQLLLITHNSHYSMEQGYTKQYRLNLHGVYRLAQQLGIEYNPRKLRRSVGVKTAVLQHQHHFDSPFQYELKSNRYWNELQHIRTDIRAELFAHYGFTLNYDIKNALPTVIAQIAYGTGRIRKPLHTIDEYTQDPHKCRLQLAHYLNCDAQTAKKIIVATFNGATLRPGSKIESMLSRLQLHKLKHNSWYLTLKQELNRAWSAIARDQGRRSIPSRKRMEIYLEIERKIMHVVERAFAKKNIPIFLEHDGWRAKDWIDPYQLKLNVQKSTGYRVEFTCEVYR